MKLTESFQNQAQVFLAEMPIAFPLDEIEQELRHKKILKPSILSAEFKEIWQAHLKAFVSQLWSRYCIERKIDSKEAQEVFFRTVLDDYAEKKNLQGASDFSEALYAANAKAEQEPLFSILVHFFKKLGMEASIKAEDVSEPIQWLASAWEGYSNHLDNEFDDFIARLRVDGKMRA